MNVDRFKSHKAGRLVPFWLDDKEYLAFGPNPLPPALTLDSKELLIALSNADRALGELRVLGRTSIMPQRLARFTIRNEARQSSEIEGTHTNILDLYAYEAGQLALPGMGNVAPEKDTILVLNYEAALYYGLEQYGDTGTGLRLIGDMHLRLFEGHNQKKVVPGQFRTAQNWIGRSDNINAAAFVPPPVAEMQRALKDLESYVQQAHDLPPLIRLALIHYQFEAIHPFIDGNGRVGRLFLLVLLVAWDLLTLPLLDLSTYFERNRADYFRLLLAVSEEGKWNDWLLFFLQGIAEQAGEAAERIERVQNLQHDWQLRLINVGAPAKLLPIMDNLFDNPVFNVPTIQNNLLGKNYSTAQRYVQKLVDAGIAEPLPLERYGRWYLAREVLALYS